MFASYDASFYFAGVIIIMSGLVSCLIPVIHRCSNDKPVKEAGNHFPEIVFLDEWGGKSKKE